MRGREILAVIDVKHADRSDLQLAVGGSGHGAEFIRGAPPAFEKGGRAAVASLFPAGRDGLSRCLAGLVLLPARKPGPAELAEGPAFLAPGMPGLPADRPV
jgi:hypothetical protein